MKYIGPFLRLNTLNKENIKNQLFHLSKESLKDILFNSKCGILMNTKEFRNKKTSEGEVNVLKHSFPIISIYKKSNPKLKNVNDRIYWADDKFKKEINITTNAFMTLSLLELADYYRQFEDIDKRKHCYHLIYDNIAKKQLQFYASNLRNEEGVFIDKIDLTDSSSDDYKLEAKDNKFKFSDQALLMAAFYKASLDDDSEDVLGYRNFSLDILNMFLEYRHELYTLSIDELLKLCFALNVFYGYSKNEDANLLMLDIFELINENYINHIELNSEIKIENLCLSYINSYLLYKNTGFIKYKDIMNRLNEELIKCYNEEWGIFVKLKEKDPLKFSPMDISLYLLCLMISSENLDCDSTNLSPIIASVYKRQLINSGMILSWPEAPTLDDRERYKNFSLNSDDLLDESEFKPSYIASPENLNLASVFIKSVKYNEKKSSFKQGKSSFYSDRNVIPFFFMIYIYNISCQ
ncbi:hypothetical protein KQI86_13600 [Clostridium sp. MSJ-11]|uniref:Uncharacterized protein n=1 Tax=Clostridium mobile TaxID=2841512 RepID=A0ABS6EJG7_9CLOT|nr:hypothetical protein [Clostridium mobile]MBU5485373.1 hypothetical protein [Clostridium mobile]